MKLLLLHVEVFCIYGGGRVRLLPHGPASKKNKSIREMLKGALVPKSQIHIFLLTSSATYL